MNVVDSSGWLAYFAGEFNARYFDPLLKDTESLLVPVITIYEVFKVILREANEDAALQAAAAMQKGHVLNLHPQLATSAARLCLQHELPLADSLILASARAHQATLWTQDTHFKDLPGVRFFRRK